MYKKGEDYKKALNAKKERAEKEKEKDKDNEKKDNKMEKRGLEYIDDFEEEDDPLFKVEKIKDLKKEKDNFLALLNKPTEEVNLEEENNDVIVDNIDKDGNGMKTEQIGRFKEIWEDDDEEKEKEKKTENEKEKEKEKEDNKDTDKNNDEKKTDNVDKKENNESQEKKEEEKKEN